MAIYYSTTTTSNICQGQSGKSLPTNFFTGIDIARNYKGEVLCVTWVDTDEIEKLDSKESFTSEENDAKTKAFIYLLSV